MKRFPTAVFASLALLCAGFFWLFPVSAEEPSVLQQLLDLPAPPPPNPLAAGAAERPPEFYDKEHPPSDDAPIADVLAYWARQSSSYERLGHNAVPSSRTLSRILTEIRKDPSIAASYLNILSDSSESAELIKSIYDSSETDPDKKNNLKRWLLYNSPYFSSDLEGIARNARDEAEYVSNQEELLSLASVDWARAEPIANSLYANGKTVSGTLAKWVLYLHALRTNSTDVDRYREELKAVVEDRTATPGMRDLAFDALVKEKDWSGRDEWYFSLLSDETLADLRVNGQSYTGLTTIVRYSPPDKYAAKMIELTSSRDPVVRTAAVKNLLVILDEDRPEVAKALLPWLENRNWVKAERNERSQLIKVLQSVKMPESVPGLIAVLDEKETAPAPYEYRGMTSAAAANARVVTVANAIASAANAAKRALANITVYPYRRDAIEALSKQADARALPALRRILQNGDPEDQLLAIGAIQASNGFSTAEQLDALEEAVRTAPEADPDADDEAVNAIVGNAMNTASTRYYSDGDSVPERPKRPLTQAEIRSTLGKIMLALTEPSEDLIAAAIARIGDLERKDRTTASKLRAVVIKWPGGTVNRLALHDLKTGRADLPEVLRLLALRKELREKQLSDISDARSAGGQALGISACLLEDPNDYETVLAGSDAAAASALLACGRLIRAPLDIGRVAGYLKAKDPMLVLAAERYLESEDSAHARSIVLSLHPNEAKILGATTCFDPKKGVKAASIPFLDEIFRSVDPTIEDPSLLIEEYSNEFGDEKRMQDEVTTDADLLGIYRYDDNILRIFTDKVVFSWEQDSSRYRERKLTSEEFKKVTDFVSENRLDEMAPFITCSGDDEYGEGRGCEPKELLMLGKQGGRRLFFLTEEPPKIVVALDRIFKELREAPSKQKYLLSKKLPGLEVLLADDSFEVMTVWKNGGDLRVAGGEADRREKIEAEVRRLAASENYAPERISELIKLRESKLANSVGWRAVENGGLGGNAAEPPGFELVSAYSTGDADRWGSHANAYGIRSQPGGIYRVTGAKQTLIAAGAFHESGRNLGRTLGGGFEVRQLEWPIDRSDQPDDE